MAYNKSCDLLLKTNGALAFKICMVSSVGMRMETGWEEKGQLNTLFCLLVRAGTHKQAESWAWSSGIGCSSVL